MNSGKLVFAQVMSHLPLTTFRRCVARYNGEHKVKHFTCLDQFLCLAFAQLTYRESLRDIEACLRSQSAKLYHMGFRSTVSRNTLANANAVRDWRIYADFAQSLIGIARPLYVDEPFGVDLSETVYALDATTIDLSVGISVGSVSFDQGSDQAAYAARPARQYSQLHPHQRRQAARCEHPRPDHSRGGRVLHHGSRLSRLHPAASLAPSRQFFRDTSQGEFALHSTILPADRPHLRHHLRPTGYADRLLFSATFPNDDQTHKDQRCRGQDAGLLDQPPQPVGAKHRRSLSLSLANRIVLQMDQTASAYQVFLRYFRERGQVSNLDRSISLRSGRHPEKAAEHHRFALRNATNLKPHYVRENGSKSTVGTHATGHKFTGLNQPVVSVRLTLGH